MKSWLFRIAFILSLLAAVLAGTWWAWRAWFAEDMLRAAVARDNPERVKLLIRMGAPIDTRLGQNSEGETLLFWAVTGGDLPQYPGRSCTVLNEPWDMMPISLSEGEVIVIPSRLDFEPKGPESAARHTDIVRLLLARNADVELEGEKGATPLHGAVWANSVEKVRLLLEHGANPNIHDETGRSPAYLAARKGNTETLKLLISHGAALTPKDHNGRTFLHLAAAYGHVEIATLLLDHGADPNAKDDAGWTPLHMTAPGKYSAVAELLISKGADPKALSKNGTTPMDLWPELADIMKAMRGRGDTATR